MRQLSFIEFSRLSKSIDHVLHAMETCADRTIDLEEFTRFFAAIRLSAHAAAGRVASRPSRTPPLLMPLRRLVFARCCSAAAIAPVSYTPRPEHADDIPHDGMLGQLLNTPGTIARRIA